jgi:uncharacterized membrane protein
MQGISQLLNKQRKDLNMANSFLRAAVDAFDAVGIWFFTIACLALIGMTLQSTTKQPPFEFYILLTYATAISLIISSPIHSMLTHLISDEIFVGKMNTVVNGLMAASILIIIMVGGVSGIIVFNFSQIMLHQKIGFIGLTAFLALFWCISAVMSALKKERIFFFMFLGGMALTLMLYFTFRPVDTQPLILFFSIGIAIPVGAGYSYVIKLYIRSSIRIDWSFLKRRGSIKLGMALMAFTLGFWADKIVFWYAISTGQARDRLFHYCEIYDYPFFVALTIMMIGSVMVYRGIKAKIAKPYQSFIFKLTNNFPFRDLAMEKHNLFYGIGHVTSSILFIYGGISIYILFLVYLKDIAFPWNNPYVFYYLLLGTIFFALFFFYFLMIQYFDDYNLLLKLNLFFLGLNSGLSILSIYIGEAFYGSGFMLASIISSLAGYAMVKTKVGGLEFEIFKNALRQNRSA